ncbi:MAG: hypothetical protein CVU87_02680 [Firmicutes bacterium HGW-Firmicutes-12]|jgi:excisionase family DNA binding protein|nr:MAG: hypothetical protein CVU87_02680 [Firmicutes bacterium HGW-Firmicutes-12]
MSSELITQEELCKWLKISVMTSYRWRKEGMPFLQVGRQVRFEKDVVLKWLKDKEKE